MTPLEELKKEFKEKFPSVNMYNDGEMTFVPQSDIPTKIEHFLSRAYSLGVEMRCFTCCKKTEVA